MTGNLQAIGFLFTWVLGWGIGGSLIDAGLIYSGVYSLEGGQFGTVTTFILWSLLWGGGGSGSTGAGPGRSLRSVDPQLRLGDEVAPAPLHGLLASCCTAIRATALAGSRRRSTAAFIPTVTSCAAALCLELLAGVQRAPLHQRPSS